MELPLLNDILLIFLLSLVAILLTQRLRLPNIVAFLAAGVLAGPHGLGLVTSIHEVELAAEVGVVLLLFTIGMEFSLQTLLAVKRAVLLGGGLQLGLTIGVIAVAAWAGGRAWGQAGFAGFLAALSSTAIVLKLLQEKAALDGPAGRTSLAMLIMQDLAVVPLMLLTPFLAGAAGGAGEGGLMAAAKGVGVVAALVVGAKWLLPRLLRLVADTRNRELFLLAILSLGLGVACLTAWAGLSLALGAFIAGLIISESPYSHQALGSVLPMRDVFTSLFFVSIGMLLDLGYVWANPLAVGLALALVLGIKTLTGGLASLALGLPFRVAAATGLILGQVGEFSFVLARLGQSHGLLSGDNYQLFLAVTVLTMALTPLLLHVGLHLPGTRGRSLNGEPGAAGLADHVIVVGFGLNGQNVTRACRAAGVPYVILEMNARTVRDQAKEGEPIVFGDAVNPAVLEHAGVTRARALVITMADPVGSRRVTALAKSLNPRLHLIVRTRYLQEMEELVRLGADEVIPEEYETGVEIFTRLLRAFLVPEEDIARLVAELRSGHYQMFRGLSTPTPAQQGVCDLFRDLEITTLRVRAGARLAGQTIGQVGLRRLHGVTVLAVRGPGGLEAQPGADTLLREDDLVVLLGAPENLAMVTPLFTRPVGE
ncbi:MAG: cation:proton antiporter [Deltaproteobacteria bacterium]|nr:cation:proton antiporter [Deltaproteobacteria bacterium]